MIGTEQIRKIEINSSKCVHCSWCLSACNTRALNYDKDKRVEFDEKLCIGCYLCIEVCPRRAINPISFNSN
ncbi:MAG: ATP-binding protein [Promethearchaeota archaeon]